MRLFISWSGERSGRLASLLKDALEELLQRVEPFLSSEDITAGSEWAKTLMAQLADAKLAIACLTPENKSAPWLHFEIGAAAKAIPTNPVIPVLLGLSPTDVEGPLSVFQMTTTSEADMKRLLRSVNKALEKPRDETVLMRSFDRDWPTMNKAIRELEESAPQSSSSAQRSTDDMVREILQIARELNNRSVFESSSLRNPITVDPRLLSLGTIAQSLPAHLNISTLVPEGLKVNPDLYQEALRNMAQQLSEESKRASTTQDRYEPSKAPKPRRTAKRKA